ncbi:MAG: VWA domain-containing protein, partial [Myxococcaceae bacterium]
MKANAQPTFEKIRFDQPSDLHLLVTLEVPHVEWQSRRPAVCVIPVVDVSGSMGGEKLHYAKESVRKLIDHLAPGDFFGLVTFSDEVATVAPPTEITQARKAELKKAVGALETQGSTHFAGGLLAGLGHANERHIPARMMRRVIMFTDGLPNVGIATRTPELVALMEANRGTASVSAFGFGADADQDLLRELSTRGDGNYAFVKSPEDALTAFARELGGLLSTYARNIEVGVRPGTGTKLLEVLSDVEARQDGDTVRIRIPDLLSEELLQLVVALRVDAHGQPGVGTIAAIEGTFEILESGRVRARTFSCEAQVRFVAPGEEQTRPTLAVDEAVAMAQLVQAQIEAEQKAMQGDFAGSRAVLDVLLGSLKDRGHTIAAEACDRVLASVADRAAYVASTPFR